MEKHLRLLAILPPDPVFSHARQEQERISKTWGPHHALRTPPHVTVIPPLALETSELRLLNAIVEVIAPAIKSFPVALNGYGAFKPRVIFIQPEVSEPLMELYKICYQAVRSKLPHTLDQYPDKPFHPHITLAHKDVSRTQFEKMWEYYSMHEYHASFMVDHYSVLRHENEGWKVEKEFQFIAAK